MDFPTLVALRSLEVGVRPVEVYYELMRSKIPPSLVEVLDLFDGDQVMTSDEVIVRLNGSASIQTISNRLAALSDLGLLVRVGKQIVKGGGRRYVYMLPGPAMEKAKENNDT